MEESPGYRGAGGDLDLPGLSSSPVLSSPSPTGGGDAIGVLNGPITGEPFQAGTVQQENMYKFYKVVLYNYIELLPSYYY